MKRFVLACFLVIAVSASSLQEHEALFQAFKEKHGKTYRNQVEEVKRFNIFRNNLKSIEEHNALFDQGLTSYKKAVNKFADLTTEEFKAMLTYKPFQKRLYNVTFFELPAGVEPPASIDWRTKGVVTPVKNQGYCGSCWAFSLTGTTEGVYALKSGNLVSLSEQQLIDCTTDTNDGCDGGFEEKTFPYIQKNGLDGEKDYPYTARNGKCTYDASKVVANISSFVVITPGSEVKLEQAVGTVAPISIAVDASEFQFYEGGIFDDDFCGNSEDDLNHAILAVGYDSANDQKYWIVKNSWGSDWGEEGYIKMLRGVNQCGIAVDTTYPVI